MPYACRAFGFKSKNIPSLEVLSADGRSCKAYNSKSFNGFEHIEKTEAKKKKKVFFKYIYSMSMKLTFSLFY